jgi:hypothetical protein
MVDNVDASERSEAEDASSSAGSANEAAEAGAPATADGAEGAAAEDTAGRKRRRAPAVARPYPRRSIEAALCVPRALKDHNGGNPWSPAEVAKAAGIPTGDDLFYVTAASRDYGFTEGTRNTKTISLTPFGRRAVYPQSPEAEQETLRQAFFRIEIFKKVVDYYKGSRLPEKRFLSNALETTFGLDPRTHDEFVDVFTESARYVGVGDNYDANDGSRLAAAPPAGGSATTTVAAPRANGTGLTCFVIMPFVERSDDHATGFFEEVLTALFTPAATAAGFTVKTALRQGSDIIQSTIVSELLQADLVLADLTEHNPNVLFELGMRMARDLPVALVRAKGTGRIFDVDNMLRVLDYSPNLWPSTVEKDVPQLMEHIIATWENRDTAQTFMKLLGSVVK